MKEKLETGQEPGRLRSADKSTALWRNRFCCALAVRMFQRDNKNYYKSEGTKTCASGAWFAFNTQPIIYSDTSSTWETLRCWQGETLGFTGVMSHRADPGPQNTLRGVRNYTTEHLPRNSKKSLTFKINPRPVDRKLNIFWALSMKLITQFVTASTFI